jgi:hypothetical protein
MSSSLSSKTPRGVQTHKTHCLCFVYDTSASGMARRPGPAFCLGLPLLAAGLRAADRRGQGDERGHDGTGFRVSGADVCGRV